MGAGPRASPEKHNTETRCVMREEAGLIRAVTESKGQKRVKGHKTADLHGTRCHRHCALFYMIVFHVHSRVAFTSFFHGLRNSGLAGLSDLPKGIANTGTEIQIQTIRFHSPQGSRRCQMAMCRLRLREDVGHGGGPPPCPWMKTLILYKWHPGAPSSPQK